MRHALSLMVLLAAGVLPAFTFATGAENAPPVPAERPMMDMEEEVLSEGKSNDLHQAMEDLGKLRQTLAGQIKNGDSRQETIETIVAMEQALISAKMMTPAAVGALAEPEKTRALAAYRSHMNTVAAKLFRLEITLLEGDAGETEKAFQQVNAAIKAGHKDFKPKKSAGGH
jgi:hypothetical protein